MAFQDREAPWVHLELLAKMALLEYQALQVVLEKRAVQVHQVHQERKATKDYQGHPVKQEG